MARRSDNDGSLAGGIGWRERLHKREEWKKLLRMARNRCILHMPMNERMNDEHFSLYVFRW